MVAPSDMMDNRIGAIKKLLDENGLGGKVQGLLIWSPVHSNAHQCSSHFFNVSYHVVLFIVSGCCDELQC